MRFQSARPLGELVEIVSQRFKNIEKRVRETRDDVAEVLGLVAQLMGDPDAMITGVAAIEDVQGGELVFANKPKLGTEALDRGAAAVAVRPDVAQKVGTKGNLIVTGYPKLVVTTIMGRFFTRPTAPAEPLPGHPGVYAGRGVEIGEGTILHPGVVIGHGSRVGRDCVFWPNVVVYDGVTIGHGCVFHSGTVIGAEGFGYEQVGYRQNDGRTAFVNIAHPHLGGVIIEDDVELGAMVCVDRGLMADTVVGAGTKVDNQVQIAHNCLIGRDVVMAAHVGISGSVEVGDCVMFSGKSGSADGIRIGRDAILLGQAGAAKDIPDGRELWAGFPTRPNREYLRRQASIERYYRLWPEMAKKLGLKP